MRLKYRIAIAVIITVTVLFFAGALFGISSIKIDNDINNFLPSDNPVIAAHDKILDAYGDGNDFLVGVESLSGDVLTVENLRDIDALTEAFARIRLEGDDEVPADEEEQDAPEMETDLLSLIDDTTDSAEPDLEGAPPIRQVLSVTNLEIIKPSVSGMEVITLSTPKDETALSEFRELLFGWDLYDGLLFRKTEAGSSDITSIVVSSRAYLSGDEKSSIHRQIEATIAEIENDDLKFHIAGQESVNVLIASFILKDLRILVPVTLLVVISILYFFFRRFSHVVITLLPVLISITLTMGIMGFVGMPLSIVSAAIPIILITIGSADAIHLLIHYLKDSRSIHPTRKIIDAVKHLILPVTMTTVTTGLGFLSLAFTSIVPIRSFGIFAAVGVSISWVITLIFAPCLILLFKAKPQKDSRESNRKSQDRITHLGMRWLRFLTKHQIAAWLGFSISIVIFALCIINIKVESDTVRYFKKRSSIVQATNFYNNNLSGVYNINIHFEDFPLTDPRILATMDRVAKEVEEAHSEVKKTLGFHSFVKKMNDSLNYDKMLLTGESFDEIPQNAEKYGITTEDLDEYLELHYGVSSDLASTEQRQKAENEILRQLIVQSLTLYGGNLEEYSSGDILDPNGIRMTLFMDRSQEDVLEKVMHDASTSLDEMLPQGVSYTIAGIPTTIAEVNAQVLRNQLISLVIALAVVFFFVWSCFRSALMSLIAMLGPMITFLMTFTMMGITGVRLDLGTSLIAAITIGIGVDYSIHLITSFQRFRKRMSFASALASCYRKVGMSIFFNAVSVGAGFFILVFSRFNILAFAGGLSALAMVIAAMLSLFFIPFLFYIEEKRKNKKKLQETA